MPKRQRTSESTAGKDANDTKVTGGDVAAQAEETKKDKEELDDLFGALAQGKRRKKQVPINCSRLTTLDYGAHAAPLVNRLGSTEGGRGCEEESKEQSRPKTG